MRDTVDVKELMASAYICSSSTDQLMLGMAGHVTVAGVFLTKDGVPIVYFPSNPKGRWFPMGGGMGLSLCDVSGRYTVSSKHEAR